MDSIVAGFFGAIVVVVILMDIAQSIVVPRRVPRWSRPTSFAVVFLWLLWRGIGIRLRSRELRETFLASFGPLAVILLLLVWAISLVLGYGLILEALRLQIRPPPENLSDAIYFAGTAFLTIGFGDLVPRGGGARVVALMAGGSGLGLFALVISFLYSLYGSFQEREVAVVALEASAGAPPSGVTML